MLAAVRVNYPKPPEGFDRLSIYDIVVVGGFERHILNVSRSEKRRERNMIYWFGLLLVAGSHPVLHEHTYVQYTQCGRCGCSVGAFQT